jgi:hypothetical protein
MNAILGWVPEFAVGEMVAWEMIDRATMAGRVVAVGYQTYGVRRVDGTEVTLRPGHPGLRRAAGDDVPAAIGFFLRGQVT